jgi:hypothetical protein
MGVPNKIDGAFQLAYTVPGPVYFGTKTAIEALTGIQSGAFAIGYTTTLADGQFGFFDGTAWRWDTGGGGGTPGGSDTEIQVNDSGAFAGYPTFRRQANGAIVIGDIDEDITIEPYSIGQGADGSSIAKFLESFGASVASYIALLRARGTHDAPEAVQSGDVIGRIRGRAHDGSNWSNTQLEIRLVADGDWSTGDHPARIEIYTTPDGSDTLTLVMTIKSDGNINIAENKQYQVGGVAIGKGFETAGRLTLASGEPVPSSEQENKTTVYFTPYNGNLRTFISGKTLSFAELSLDMSAWAKNCLHDIYCYDNSNVVAIEGLSWGTETEYNISAASAAASVVITFTAAVGTNPFVVGDKVCVQGITGNMGSDVLHTAWWTVTAIGGSNPNWTVTLGSVSTSAKTYTSGGTIRKLKETRTTNIEFVNGVLVKDGDDSRVYLGTLYIDGNGYCFQAPEKMTLWNYYNQAEFRLYFDIDSPHSYNSTTYRYYNGNALCFVSFVCGVDNFLINASVAGQWGDVTTGSEAGYAAIGVDGTTDLLFPNAVMSINGRLAVPVFVVGNGAGCRKMTLCEAAVGTITMSNYTLSAIYKA